MYDGKGIGHISDYEERKHNAGSFSCKPVVEDGKPVLCVCHDHDFIRFVHTAAHDLKSPLRRIVSYCEILEEDAAERLTEEDQQILKRMDVNAHRMQDLVDKLLSYALIDHDEGLQEKTNLNALVKDVLNEYREQIEQTGAQILLEDLPEIYGYPEQIRQLFSNLVSNALKYRSDRPLHIKIQCEKRQNPVTICVADNGQGLPAEQKDMIFDAFKRLHTQEEIEGTGLGLSICKKIVERHAGSIWVESDPGNGACFYFTLDDRR